MNATKGLLLGVAVLIGIAILIAGAYLAMTANAGTIASGGQFNDILIALLGLAIAAGSAAVAVKSR